jgi:hypothetical protein
MFGKSSSGHDVQSWSTFGARSLDVFAHSQPNLNLSQEQLADRADLH